MITIIIIVVILILGKFIYDTYLTDNTDRRYNDYINNLKFKRDINFEDEIELIEKIPTFYEFDKIDTMNYMMAYFPKYYMFNINDITTDCDYFEFGVRRHLDTKITFTFNNGIVNKIIITLNNNTLPEIKRYLNNYLINNNDNYYFNLNNNLSYIINSTENGVFNICISKTI